MASKKRKRNPSKKLILAKLKKETLLSFQNSRDIDAAMNAMYTTIEAEKAGATKKEIEYTKWKAIVDKYGERW